MKILYTAPNRGHHYRYAESMHSRGILYKFVSGFSRFSPRAPFPELGSSLCRVDILQNIYLASLKFHMPNLLSKELAYRAKIEQDNSCSRFLDQADIFMFYNGSGLNTCKKAKERNIITVVEAVNSHVDYQETIMRREYESLKLNWVPFHKREKQRRIAEYELADYILLPSNFVKRSFLEYGFSEEKLLKVPYGFNSFLEDKVNITDRRNDDFTILYVGSISVRKGLRYLVQAFNELKHPRKRLVIVGPIAKATGLENIPMQSNIEFRGVLKGKQLEKEYLNADVFCLPSIEEGLALVLGEALSFGIPIIATKNTGVEDIITDKKEGFIVPIRSSKDILEKLDLLASDPFLLENMKNRALEKSKHLDGWNENGRLLCDKLLDVFNSKII